MRGSIRVSRTLAVAAAATAFFSSTFVVASAATVNSAVFTGSFGTATVGSTLYAKAGAALTLTVKTDAATSCLRLSGDLAGDFPTGGPQWTFSVTAASSDGVHSVTATPFGASNPQNKCTGNAGTPLTASYIGDNTGPVVTAALSPLPNAAGWNNSNVSVTWSATDAGSGVASGPTPATDGQSANTSGATKTASATDRLGNTGTGSVTVKLDKSAPTITGSVSRAANANGWNNTNVTVSFSCTDGLSGIKTCSGPTTLTSSAASQSVTGSATDNADNTSSSTVSGVNIDKVAPLLSGAPTTSPNLAGWYNTDVTIQWTASDALSGLAGSAPANSTISSEGSGLTASASVSDMAGNTTTATSSPAVKIDKTAPTTTATAPSNWNNTDVTVALGASDALSGVAATYFTVDGGAQQAGTSVPVSTEGVHTLQFWSVDNAGNTEAANTVQVKIDKTPPTINHTQFPLANGNGWNNTDVTVTFTCGDTLSGLASCTSPQTVATEGQSQAVTGSATDNAGNSATDPATVSIDKTKPTISATPDRAPNEAGWYDADVTVSFSCADVLSGIASCSAPQTLGEGAAQSATGVASDAADNTQTGTVAGINVDKTAPALVGTPSPTGWTNADVTVTWTCTDGGSGVADEPAASTVTGEGANLSASAGCTDVAGNTASTTVSGISIDRTPPVTTASVPDPLTSGWYAGPVNVTLTATDALSGVATTYYSLDGAAPQVYNGPFADATPGTSTVTFWSTDAAGNTEDNAVASQTITLKIDNLPPTITGSRTPDANANGWNNTVVTVGFDCHDAESGLASCSDPTTLSTEGAGQSVTGMAQDIAGNTSSATVAGINIDTTAPDLAGVPTQPANAGGWYKGDVTIHWQAADGLSGIDAATQPSDSVVTGEGSNLGAGPVSVFDLAGNSAIASVSGIKIDRSAPVITGAPTSAPNGTDGWYLGDVTVDFHCTDPLLADSSAGSGVASCPSSAVVSGDGANQSVTSGVATDMAGNTAAGVTVGGINIDGHAPQTTSNNVCTSKNNWCTGTTATVALSASDIGPSGVKEIHYSVNGGPGHVESGSSYDVTIPLNGSGHATVTYYAVDNAGNVETPNTAALDYDNIAPTMTHTLTPDANASGWNRDDVTVHFSATDDDQGSGLDATSITPDVTVSSETSGQVVTGHATDLAGNVGTDSVTVKLDKTAPTINGAIVAGTLGNNGWYTSPVKVHFTCADALSGIPSSGCPDDVTLSANGSGQSVTRSVTDVAGNSANATVSGINIDATKPTISSVSVANGAVFTLGDPAAPSGTPTCTATDAGSGVASCSVAVTGGQPNGVGTFSFTATATDNAGNTATQSGSYKVVYGWPGFLQPINDTAHQIGTSTSVFKAGSTVPVKFQLLRVDGSIATPSALPMWITPLKGSAMAASVDESVYTDAPTSGSTYRYDATAQQWIYNWSTKGLQAGYFYRIGVTLDDGQTYYVSIGLR